jgi:predicted permease
MPLWNWLFHRKQHDEDLDEEIQAHLRLAVQEHIERGESPEAARAAARREFGNVTLVKETTRDMWGWTWLETLLQDLRYGLRQLARSPGFTAVVALSLALGIGANTAIFSLINAVMLRALPVQNPRGLVLLNRTRGQGIMAISSDNGSDNSSPFSFPDFEEFRAHNQGFSSLFGFVPLGKPNINIDGQASLVQGELVTADYFSGLGVVPILGRALTGEDVKPSAPRAAVISYGFWSRQFGRNPAALGKGITVNGVPTTVVGVAPPEFFGVQPGRAIDLWLPLAGEATLLPYGMKSTPGNRPLFAARDWNWLIVMGRLKPGVSEQQAASQLDVLFQQSMAAELKKPLKPGPVQHLRLEPAARGLAILRQEFSRPLWILMSIVGALLLIACANVATLLVARSSVRQKEIAVRLSLGAPRQRLVRQLLTESVLLAVLGGVLGLLFAFWGSRALVLLMSSGGEPLSMSVRPDATVLAFTAAVALLTGILFGLVPALRSTRVDLTPALKARTGELPVVSQRSRQVLGKSLVIAQVAMSLPLLIGAALFVRTLRNLENQNFGFNPHHLLLFAVDPAKAGYTPERQEQFYRQLLARLQALPGARAASMSEINLVSDAKNSWGISIEGRKPKPGQDMNVDWNNVGPSFFPTMGIPLLLGRGIEWRDTATSPKVAVVNQAFARALLDGQNPLGYRFNFAHIFWETTAASQAYEIVGMVQDAKYAELRDAPRPTIYIPFCQDPMPPWAAHFEVRTAGDPLALAPAVRSVVRDLDLNVPLSDVKTQTEQVAETLVQERLFARLSSFFGGLAVLLACIGLYGLMAYAVARRTGEIGIRMVLGARPRDILGMVVRETAIMVAMGAAIGIPAAIAVTRFIRSILFGLRPTDPLAITISVLAMLAAAALASYLPARRATHVDPMVALRWE